MTEEEKKRIEFTFNFEETLELLKKIKPTEIKEEEDS